MTTVIMVTEFPCPTWCALPTGHPFEATDGGLEKRAHEHDVFDGEHRGYLVVREVEVRMPDGTTGFGGEQVFLNGVEQSPGKVRQVAAWLAEYVNTHDLKPNHLAVIR